MNKMLMTEKPANKKLINNAVNITHELDICIISLQENKIARQRLLAGLQQQGLAARVSMAVNGKMLTAEAYFFQCKILSSRWFRRKILTPSELGCWLSHRNALSEFMQGNKSWLLVLEDDVLVSADLSLLVNRLPQLDNTAIYLLGGQNGLKSFRRVMFRRDNNGFPYAICGTQRWLYRTCCYLVGRPGGQQILDLMKKSPYIADDWAYILRNTAIKKLYYQHYFSHPEDLSGSTIEDERLFINRKL